VGRPLIDLAGFRTGMMTVLHVDPSYALVDSKSRHRWIVQCDCGNKKSISGQAIRTLGQKSCGCMRGVGGRFEKKHVGVPKPALQRWQNMMRRCYKPANEKDAKNYMLRGITVCAEWHDSAAWYRDMGDPPFIGASIDRIDNNGNYEKSNCRWATASQQNLNRRKFSRRKGNYH
jgi:hypothetical protein